MAHSILPWMSLLPGPPQPLTLDSPNCAEEPVSNCRTKVSVVIYSEDCATKEQIITCVALQVLHDSNWFNVLK